MKAGVVSWPLTERGRDPTARLTDEGGGGYTPECLEVVYGRAIRTIVVVLQGGESASSEYIPCRQSRFVNDWSSTRRWGYRPGSDRRQRQSRSVSVVLPGTRAGRTLHRSIRST